MKVKVNQDKSLILNLNQNADLRVLFDQKNQHNYCKMIRAVGIEMLSDCEDFLLTESLETQNYAYNVFVCEKAVVRNNCS